jgi:hypothetical protein
LKNGYEIVDRDGGKMGRVKMKDKKVIELFNEKTGEVVRTICFRDSKEFDKFIKDFKAMRYPGYGWRYSGKGKKKEE